MSLPRSIFHHAGESLIGYVARGTKNLRKQEVQDGTVEAFTIEIKRYREFRTSIVFTWRSLRWFVWIFLLIPTPFFFFLQLDVLLQQPAIVISDYIETFAWVYLLLIFTGVFMFFTSLSTRVPAKYSRLRPGDELMQKRYATNQIFVDPLTVYGVVHFAWESVAVVRPIARQEILIEYTQSAQWWRRLKEYVGVRLCFKSEVDRDRFCDLAKLHLANLEANLTKQDKKREEKRKEQQKIHDIMHGRSSSSM